jgi:sterol desaturase/sphingolipid hydroxylase (fatty acid hydroxylase superfamily)
LGKTIGADGVCVYEGLWWKLALPSVTFPAHLAIVGGTCWLAAQRTDCPWRDVCEGIAIGWIAWTMFEYAFHRWLLHHMRTPLLRRIFWKTLHREHHGYRTMLDPDHHTIHIAISAPVILAIIGTIAAASTGAVALAAGAGWAAGYVAYEALHWVFHTRDPDTGFASLPPLRGLSKAHYVHHLRRTNRNYGFVTRFWDRALSTAWSTADSPVGARDPSTANRSPRRPA